MPRRSALKSKQPPLPFEVWALVGAGFCVAMGYGVLAPAIPQFAIDFGVSNFWASAIVSAFALMRLVAAPPAGWLVTRFGERRTHASGLGIVALSTAACIFAADFTQLLILRALGGVGSAMFTIAATALIIKVSPIEQRGRVAGINAAGFLFGNLIGPVFGALVAGFGIRAPFVFYFCTLVAAIAVVWFSLRNSVLAAGGKGFGNTERLTLPQALRVPQYRSLLTSTFVYGWATYGVRVTAVPLFVAFTFPGDPTLAAWVLAAYAGGNVLFIIPAGRWIDSVGRKPLLIAGMAIFTLGFFLFPVSPNFWIAAGIMCIAGVGSAFVNPGQQAVLADVVGARSGGSAIAAYSMVADLGAVIGPLIVGAIIDAAGFGWGFSLTAALLAIGLLSWIVIPDSRRLHALNSENGAEEVRDAKGES